MKILYLLPLALLSSCGQDTEEASLQETDVDAGAHSSNDQGTEEPGLPETGAAAVAPSSHRPADTWSAQQITGDDPLSGVVSHDGSRHTSWRLQFGDEISSLSYGFVGARGGEVRATTTLLTKGEKVLSVELQEIRAEDLLMELEALGSNKATTDDLRIELGKARSLRYTVSLGNGSEVQSSSSGHIPGSKRDADIWSGSSRQIIGSSIGKIGEPMLLGSEVWIKGDGSFGSRSAQLGPDQQIQVTFTVNGEPQMLRDYQGPAWVFFIMAE